LFEEIFFFFFSWNTTNSKGFLYCYGYEQRRRKKEAFSKFALKRFSINEIIENRAFGIFTGTPQTSLLFVHPNEIAKKNYGF